VGTLVVDPTCALGDLKSRDERDLRIQSAIAMWLGGAGAIGLAVLLPDGVRRDAPALIALLIWCLLAALISYLIFPKASERTLYALNNLFSTLGALTVFGACYYSGGAASGMSALFFFPVLYDAYFFRAWHALGHLVINSALALAPLLYSSQHVVNAHFARMLVMVAVFWLLSAVLGAGKRRLLDAERAARRQALSDPLTGLHNLRSLRLRARELGPATPTGLVLIDIDDFKGVNTRYGHTGADRLLQRIASALVALSEPDHCVSRIGGDELAILLPDADRSKLRALEERAGRAIAEAGNALWGDRAQISASIGSALSPQQGVTLNELLRAADRAMYSAKADLKTERPPGVLDHPRNAPANGDATALQPTGAADRRGPEKLRKAPAEQIAAGDPHGAADHLGQRMGRTWERELQLGWALVSILAAALYATLLSGTGGTRSALISVIFLAVTIAAYSGRRWPALCCLAAFVLALATTFFYAPAAHRLSFAIPFIAISSTAAVLAVILLYNRAALERARRRASELALQDPLTGLPNRRAFAQRLSDGLSANGHSAAAQLALAIIDLDNFKELNDRHGHGAGDRFLCATAKALCAITRPCDCLARIGGDELALIAAGLDSQSAICLGERCREAVEAVAGALGYSDCALSATIGIATAHASKTQPEALIEAADNALMQAKAAGKRRVQALS
jgi:diguanylate cyclase (GGDEF)-like protein